MKGISFSAGHHKGNAVLFMRFEYDRALIEKVKGLAGAKGKKDRTVALSQGILALLRKYYIAYKSQYWLFEGQRPGSPYSARSLQQIFIGKHKKPV